MYLTGLTEVPTPALEQLVRSLHRGDLTCPLDVTGLTRVGLQYVADRLAHLRGLDDKAVLAVVVAVIAERRAVERVRRYPAPVAEE